jgi:chorismate dehydratase
LEDNLLKIGEMDYANVYPLFYYLKSLKGLNFVKGVPSVLNKMIREGGLDIAPCSSIEFGKNSESYKIIPNISISCISDVKSVMLYSNLPVEKLNNKKIFLTGESSTSIVLFKILTAYFYNINVNFTNNQKDSSAAVLIGDKALYHYYNDKYPYKYDLGRAWYEMTSLPFVFGLWIINTNLKINEDELNRFIKKLLDIKQDSKKNLAALIEHYSFKGLTPYQIIDYWETINYDLTDEHIQGLNLFYEYAKMIGEIKKIPKLNFYK